MLHLFWGSDLNAINYFKELVQQMRVEDEWYDAFLQQCRYGMLSEEMWHYLMGLPTEHCGSWIPNPEHENTASSDTATLSSETTEGFATCGNRACLELPTTWKRIASTGSSWSTMCAMERQLCIVCSNERQRRSRLLEPEDTRVRREPFLNAPYVHKNNDPKYHAMLLRAVEDAKHGAQGPRCILWVVAQDVPRNPKDVARTPQKLEKQRIRFLQFHDQKTAGVPGLLPLFLNMHVRITEKIARGKDPSGEPVVLLKHTPCEVVGWDLHTGDRIHAVGSQRMLAYLPRVIYLKFAKEKWRIHPNLDVGVFPLRSVSREWVVNDATGAKLGRKGFTRVPDYASTGFMIQGATLSAAIAECGDIFSMPGLTEMRTAYAILSRVKKADGLLLLRAFSPFLFRMGTPPGPACLLKLLRCRFRKQSDATDPPYTLKEAQADYQTIADKWADEKNLQKSRGVEWRCHTCGFVYPAEGYGAKALDHNEVQEVCVARGFWRTCLALACRQFQRRVHATHRKPSMRELLDHENFQIFHRHLTYMLYMPIAWPVSNCPLRIL